MRSWANWPRKYAVKPEIWDWLSMSKRMAGSEDAERPHGSEEPGDAER